MKIEPNEKKHRENFIRCQHERSQLTNQEVSRLLTIDAKKQNASEITGLKRFYALTRKIMTKEGRLNLLSKPLDEAEKLERLKANNAT